MIYELNEQQILGLMEKASEMTVTKVLSNLGLIKELISQRESFRKYGETNVRRWRLNGKVNPHKKGGIIYYKVSELEAMKGINELFEKQFTNERKG